ncbi:flagellar protein FlaG [Methylobacillus flagellatus]|uniref:flagellar protein FlaG n=1 Tax=Methylobacillus flagellatus TaxID=405 RepID=UPI002853B365|nr:flagellar protein FlaG [Methylobacillus flagellatus]MDR5172604.1 flagellar protein FlaG [Methylobacillus flagellatus]
MAITNIEAYSQAGSLPSTVRNTGPVASLPGAGSKEPEQQASVASDADVQSAVERINEFISPIMQSIQFSTDVDSGRVVVKVVDSETQKVLRQIPSEEVLAISKALDNLQGLIIRQTA